jgi:hypothetical protein
MHQDFLGSFEVDYGFVAPPTLGKDYLTVNSRAEFYLLPNKSECPLTPGSLPNIANNDMVQVFMDAYVPNSALYVLYKGGFLQAELQQSVRTPPHCTHERHSLRVLTPPLHIGPQARLADQLEHQLLDTYARRLCIDACGKIHSREANVMCVVCVPWCAALIPALAMYANTTLAIQLQAISAPTAFFRPQGIDATARTQLTVSVITNSSKAIPLFSFELDIVANATVRRSFLLAASYHTPTNTLHRSRSWARTSLVTSTTSTVRTSCWYQALSSTLCDHPV